MKDHTLLLADDSATTQRLVQLTFAEQGVRVVTAADGQQAIERLTSERPDIVMAAINMPKVNGYELVEFMQRQPSLGSVPVLLLRGAFDEVDEPRVRQCGAAGVLVKPIEPGVVINRVKELLGMRAKAAPAPGAAGRLVTAQEPPPMRPASARPQSDASFGATSPTMPRGVGPPAPRADSARPAPAAGDAFDQLDAAFDQLDAHIADRPAAGRTASTAPSNQTAPPAASPAQQRQPVYEVDSGWFKAPTDEDLVSATRIRSETEPSAGGGTESASVPIEPSPVAPEAPASSPSLARESDASFGAVAPKRPSAAEADARPEPDASFGAASPVADAFDAMLAAEQGEAPSHHGPVDLSDEAIERIASRVAERLSEGVLMDTIVEIVTGITERMVREEIARIRAAAQAKKP